MGSMPFPYQPADPPRPEIRNPRPSSKVASILHKLDWSTGCEWSAHVSPEESELLARIVRDYYERLNDEPRPFPTNSTKPVSIKR